MHDAPARHYEPFAVDEPDQYPVLPRVSTEDLEMQVNVLGRWHRRTPDLATTACGVPFNSQFAPPRRNELTGELCDVCFCEHEINLAKAAADKERAEASEFPAVSRTRTKKDTLR